MSLKKNIIANYLGLGWTALMQLAFIPIYIKYIGMEAYGLIGVFAVLQAVLTLLDIGMTPTLNREMARYTAGAHTPQSIRVLLHSLETLCLGLACLVAIGIWMSSGWLARHWLQVEQLPLETVSGAIAMMGLVAALRFIENIYRGALLGLQTHIWLNGVTATMATARGLGAVGILVWVSPSIQAFFFWQGCISLASVIVFKIRVHQTLPTATEPVHFSKSALLGVWHFARGMIATTFLSLLLTQVDKILLSRLLSLELFGTYVLAATVASALMVLIAPLAQSYSPRFTELVARQDEPGLISAYHLASQLMTVMVVPVALLLIFHSEAVLLLWTNDVRLAHNSAHLVALLALGTALLGLMNIPYMLQLAYGWSTFAAKVNCVIVTVQIPLVFWATSIHGAVGAAWVWVAITSSYVFIVVNIMHRTLLSREKLRWYLQDTALPTLAACLVGGFLSLTGPSNPSLVFSLFWLALNVVLMFIAAVIGAIDLRRIAVNKFNQWAAHK